MKNMPKEGQTFYKEYKTECKYCGKELTSYSPHRIRCFPCKVAYKKRYYQNNKDKFVASKLRIKKLREAEK